ncbi:MAG: two-component regulator propeller domain-containing protein [Chitinophagaceae bacterium]
MPADIQFTNYSRAGGLPEEQVNTITQDSRGFIWLGTKEGLFRFDGQYYKTWYANPGDSLKFSNNNIRVVAEYKKDRVLFLSGSALWQINISNQQLQKVPPLKDKKIIATPEQLNGNGWLLSDPDSIYISDKELNIQYSISLKEYFIPGTWVSAFSIHYPWCLLSSNSYNRVFLLNYKTKQVIPFLLDDSKIDSRAKFFTFQVYDSTRKRLYFSAFFDGNFYCDLKLPQVTRYQLTPFWAQKDGAIRKSLLLPGNRLLQGGDHGLYLADSTGSVKFNEETLPDHPLISGVVLNIYQTKDGDYWATTLNGISRFNLNHPNTGYLQMNLDISSEDEFKSIIKGADGNIYFLTERESLFQFDQKTKKVRRIDKTGTYGWSAIRNGDEIIATGGPLNLLIYNVISGKLLYPAFLQPFYTKNTDLITLVFKARNGDLWYSCNGSTGLIRNPAGTQQYIQYSKTSSPPAISLSYVHCASEDSHGNIWWGSNKSPILLKWDAALQKFQEYEVSKLIPQFILNTGINYLYVDAKDNLWIALDAAALIKYNINTRKGDYYDMNRGMPTDALFGMVSDAQNRLWFGTRKGLCCYLPERDKIVTFTSYDGLQEDNFEGSGIFFDKEENLVYAGGKRTIAFFNPDTLLYKTTTVRPPAFIDEMKVNGKSWYFDPEKKNLLKPNENNIEFSFASPDFNRNNQLEFQYRLTGAADDWIDLGEKRSVTFNNLPSGTYSISVRCKHKGNESWAETVYPINFTIETPWFKTTWFRVLAALLIALLFWYIFRTYYLQKLQKQKAAAEKIQAVEKERTRIATDMHDDFGASLSRIKFISEKMQLTQSENEGLKTDLSKISDYSDEMAEKMNEIVWALNQRYDSLGDLVSFCRSYASEYLQDKNIKLHFSEGELSENKIQGEVRRNIFLVIKEALHNIVKHAGASEVAVSFRHDEKNQSISVVISDTGKGIDTGNIRPFANGLENMKKRMADINGTFTIENNNGTRITITAPV